MMFLLIILHVDSSGVTCTRSVYLSSPNGYQLWGRSAVIRQVSPRVAALSFELVIQPNITVQRRYSTQRLMAPHCSSSKCAGGHPTRQSYERARATGLPRSQPAAAARPGMELRLIASCHYVIARTAPDSAAYADCTRGVRMLGGNRLVSTVESDVAALTSTLPHISIEQ
jgi:hypothetical protein